MLDSILSFFETVGQLITVFVEFMIDIFNDIVFVVQLTGAFAMNIPDYFCWLPSECVAVISVIFAVVVIYKVLGREG